MVFLKSKSTFLGAIEITRKMLNDVMFMIESRTKETYFTRKEKKLNFKNTILFNLNFVKKSLQIELDDFFDKFNLSDISISKQGYSAARKKVSPLAFVKLSKAIVNWYYEENSFKTYRGFRLCAIDGSVLQIPDTEELRNYFGYGRNQRSSYARARASCIYDLENGIIITSKIDPYKVAERDSAKNMIKELVQTGLKNDLILFDRGYPSRDFIAFLDAIGIKYLMRCQKNTIKEIVEAKKADQIIQITHEGQVVNARVVRFLLDSDTEEILVTNLIEEGFNISEFKTLYFKRWGIETEYNNVKNKIEIENFTGGSKIAIEQDFYASIYLSNMVSLLRNDANETINEESKKKRRKHDYQVNTNILIGKLKDRMVHLLLEDCPIKRERMFTKIMKVIIRNKTPIRFGRSYPRRNGLSSTKYPLNQKRCL
ncbi:IS4 family transposase [Ureibacillus thermosphaericus]|uniref:IS4 family transposase n=1 Tax=Ureibacillus thermosphaericus TaxID=51173 RepID=UPI001E2A4A96|nr:IS4 family transposase [Ureibacillus thermosphaericus]